MDNKKVEILNKIKILDLNQDVVVVVVDHADTFNVFSVVDHAVQEWIKAAIVPVKKSVFDCRSKNSFINHSSFYRTKMMFNKIKKANWMMINKNKTINNNLVDFDVVMYVDLVVVVVFKVVDVVDSVAAVDVDVVENLVNEMEMETGEINNNRAMMIIKIMAIMLVPIILVTEVMVLLVKHPIKRFKNDVKKKTSPFHSHTHINITIIYSRMNF